MKESKDILSLFEALSSHEVFTPPRVAREMLDLIPSEVWSNPSTRLLDPCAKSGVFLREAFYKIFNGLDGKGEHKASDGIVYDLNDKQQRINHILKNMLFAIATSELTGYLSRRTVYGVMRANTDKQISALDSFEKSSNFQSWTEEEKYNFVGRNKFNEYFDHKLFCTDAYKGFEKEGNIFYPIDEVQKIVIESDNYEIEEMYFPFIVENTKHKKILDIRGGKMKFDVIIGNPPYQVSTSSTSKQARPIYHRFVEMAFDLKPKYAVMITPSRWFSGGMGLNNFRRTMMSDRRLSKLVDFPNSKDCFPGVSISGGVSYFLWNRDHHGPCLFTSNHNGNSLSSERVLDEYGVVVRFDEARRVINKVRKKEETFLSSKVSPINVFDLSSSFRGSPEKGKDMVGVTHSSGLGYIPKSEVKHVPSLEGRYKVVVSRTIAEHANEPSNDGMYKVLSRIFILGPEDVCTHSYLVVAGFKTPEEAEACAAILKTRFFRFLILQTVSGIDLSSERFSFVPYFDYKEANTDSALYQKYELDDDCISYIESVIKEWEA